MITKGWRRDVASDCHVHKQFPCTAEQHNFRCIRAWIWARNTRVHARTHIRMRARVARTIVSVFPTISRNYGVQLAGARIALTMPKPANTLAFVPLRDNGVRYVRREYVSRHTRPTHTRAAARMHKVFGTITSRVVREVETLLSPSAHVTGG